MAKRLMITGSIGGTARGYGGHAWAVLQYILGFRRLGFEAYYVELLKSQDCKDDNGNPIPFATSANAHYFRTVMDRFGLAGYSALLEWEGPGYVGLSHVEVEKLAPDVELLINRSGHFQLRSVLATVRRRMYLDVDPGFTQIWQEQYGVDMHLRGHDVYVTVGLNLGKPDCSFPVCSLCWETTLPPVVLSEWETSLPPGPAYSTVADWRGYGMVEWRGTWYGQKADEFLRVIELPRLVSVPLEICLAIHSDEGDRDVLEQHGWRLVSPRLRIATPDMYRDYVIRSRGEFAVVKHGYAAGRTGWFSDRSACYLAAGRPVIVQDTGIGDYVPTGAGLLTFDTLEGAAAAIHQVEDDYARHAATAVAFAREFLDSDRVLTRLLRLAGL